MQKTNFEPFLVGTTFNPLEANVEDLQLRADSVKVSFPSRLEAMALDPSKIAENKNLKYPAGQIDFCIDFTREVTATVDYSTPEITVTGRTPRKTLAIHAARIMLDGLGAEHGITLDIHADNEMRHVGLGSSSATVAATVAAVNELYGNPIDPLTLARFCAQNHGEEIDESSDLLMPVQCIGGSAVCGFFNGGLIVLAGESTPICRTDLPENSSFVIGIPEDYDYPDAKKLMDDEVANIEGFRSSGEVHGKEIAYRMLHEVLPGIAASDLKPCKDLIFDYRWDMGSIANCAFVYPKLTEIAEAMRGLKSDPKVDIVSLSSVGPGFFALTKHPDYVEGLFDGYGLKTFTAGVHNRPYRVERS